MPQKVFRQPDTEAMQRLLARHLNDTTGIVLRLAWRAGLTRDEIGSLTWDRLDLSGGELRLSDRAVPLDESTLACLREWQERYGSVSPYVVISEKLLDRLAPQSISRLARFALDSEGQDGIRLEDLRFDFVRRQLQSHDWPYVLRISGLSVTTYRNTLAQLTPEVPAGPEPRDADGEEFRLWQILQAEKQSSAGLALWLSTQMGLRMSEIVELTWDDLDFARLVIRLPDREAPMPRAVAYVLSDAMRRREPDTDPHVILTPRTRKPVSVARLSTMVRTILIRGGVEDRTLRYLRKDTAQELERQQLVKYAKEHGSISRSEAAELLGVSGGVAYSRLSELAFDHVLVRINSRYYPAGSVIAPEQQAEAIRRYLDQWGASYCKDIADMLHIGKRTTARILKRMVDQGEIILLRKEKRYALPKHTA